MRARLMCTLHREMASIQGDAAMSTMLHGRQRKQACDVVRFRVWLEQRPPVKSYNTTTSMMTRLCHSTRGKLRDSITNRVVALCWYLSELPMKGILSDFRFSSPGSVGESFIPAAAGITVDLLISDWTINGTKVTTENCGSDQLGQFDIDGSYRGEWDIV